MEALGGPGQEGKEEMVCTTELICVHTAAWTVTMVWSGLLLSYLSVPFLGRGRLSYSSLSWDDGCLEQGDWDTLSLPGFIS